MDGLRPEIGMIWRVTVMSVWVCEWMFALDGGCWEIPAGGLAGVRGFSQHLLTFHNTVEHPELEGTHSDHRIQLLLCRI